MFLFDFLFVTVDCHRSPSLSLVCAGSVLFFYSCTSVSSLLCVSGFLSFVFSVSRGCSLAYACSDANFSYVLHSQTQSFLAIGCLRITCSLWLSFAIERLPIVLLLALPFLFLPPVLL